MKVQQYRWEKFAKDRDALGEDGPGVLEEEILGSDEKKLVGDEGAEGDSDAGADGGLMEEDVRRRETLRGVLGGKTE